jgi:hypothetical protein
VGAGRVLETLIGAVVGVLVIVLFPPAVQTRHAGQAVERFAEEIAGPLDSAAAALSAGAVTEEQTTQWLENARRLNRHAPQVDRALADAEESRRLNLRAVGTLRSGRATRQQSGVRESPDYVDAVRGSSAFLMRQMGNVILAFGRLLRRELERSGEPEKSGGKEQEQLAGALGELDGARREVHELLLADPRSQQGLRGLNSALLTTTDRLLIELDAAVRTRQRHQIDPSIARRRAMQAAERLRATTRRRVHRPRPIPLPGPRTDEPDRRGPSRSRGRAVS